VPYWDGDGAARTERAMTWLEAQRSAIDTALTDSG
jgi:hypothetical protein